MTLTDYKFLIKLRSAKVPCSTVPKMVQKAPYFDNLLRNKVLQIEGSWSRGNLFLNEAERAYFEFFLTEHFDEAALEQESTRANNAKGLRNTKGRNTESNAVVFLRSTQKAMINGLQVDLKFYTESFETFATVLKSIVCDKICFVENLYSFLKAEKTIPNAMDYVFLHTYGRVGDSLLECIEAKEILVFSDYDYVGLNEYLKFKEKFANTSFYVPLNYDDLFENYARDLQKKEGDATQKPTERVLSSSEVIVVKIREQLFKHKKFLEQEILIVCE